jgi:four helix bundle protein
VVVRSEFRDLVAYQRSTALANELYAAISAWPTFDRWSVGIQAIRAADSVGANIAEAAGRLHAPDRRRLLLIARGSLYETEHWLATAKERRLLSHEPAGLDEVARTLGGLIAKHVPG